jgi:phosphoglycolate phosphatase-like HAD superfamily hydrolase
MNLIIFDIDGTLTQTNDVDSYCFAQAIEEVLQIKNLNTDWSSYRYSTDSGIIQQIYESYFGIYPPKEVTIAIQQQFIANLKHAHKNNYQHFKATPGAENIFSEISKLPHWHIAIATGGWQLSALFKLDSALIPHSNIPKAFADDHIERTEIIKNAVKKAKTMYTINQYQQPIYVGDKPRDHFAARQLNMGFIGIGADFRKKIELCDLFLENYQNSNTLIDYLKKIS